jgi:hypothetical protein
MIQERARNLAAALSAAGIPARQAEGTRSPGARGGELLLGAVLLEPVGKFVVQTLLDRLRAFLTGERSMKVTLKRPDGAEITIEAKNIGHAEVRDWLETARESLG